MVRIPWNKGQRTGKYLKCTNCAILIYIPISKLILKTHFCSKKCNYDYHHKIIKCDFCGKTKTYTKANYNQKKSKFQNHFFCTSKCSQKFHTAEKHQSYGKPAWSKGLTKNTHSSLKKISEKMCGYNNPMFNKKVDRSGMNFFFEDLGHRCRSSWEANFARILKHVGINYKYEPKTFKLNKGDSYTPDFYVVDFDLYVEIKGWETPKFKEKFKRFKQEYPKQNILLINQQIYYYLKEKWGNKINWEAEGRLKKNFKYKESKIKKITITNYNPKQVYNLSVEDDDSFVVNGIVVHNTKPNPFIRRVLDEDLTDLFIASIKRLGEKALIKV